MDDQDHRNVRETSNTTNFTELKALYEVTGEESSGWTIPLTIGRTAVTALIDSGTQISVIRDVAQAVGLYDQKYEPVKMRGAFPGNSSEGRLVRNVYFNIGNNTYKSDVLVSTLHEEMLLS
jgi:hypothetical protein